MGYPLFFEEFNITMQKKEADRQTLQAVRFDKFIF